MPPHPTLLDYGAGFAEFLAAFEPAAELPYLAGVARLDRFWTEAHCARDAVALEAAALAEFGPSRLAHTVLMPHPAARWAWFYRQPIYSIWQRNRYPDDATDEESESAAADIDLSAEYAGEGTLLARPRDTVSAIALDRGACAFLDACTTGCALADAAGAAMEAQPTVDLSALIIAPAASGRVQVQQRTLEQEQKEIMSVRATEHHSGLHGAWNRIADRLDASIGHSLLALVARLALAGVFLQSGRTKVEGWLMVTDNAVALFVDEYKLPLLPPNIAAHLAAYAEHFFPLLLILGLATRLSAAALLGMTAVIQIFVYPAAWPTHLTWAGLLLYLIGRGGGSGSLDRVSGSSSGGSASDRGADRVAARGQVGGADSALAHVARQRLAAHERRREPAPPRARSGCRSRPGPRARRIRRTRVVADDEGLVGDEAAQPRPRALMRAILSVVAGSMRSTARRCRSPRAAHRRAPTASRRRASRGCGRHRA